MSFLTTHCPDCGAQCSMSAMQILLQPEVACHACKTKRPSEEWADLILRDNNHLSDEETP